MSYELRVTSYELTKLTALSHNFLIFTGFADLSLSIFSIIYKVYSIFKFFVIRNF